MSAVVLVYSWGVPTEHSASQSSLVHLAALSQYQKIGVFVIRFLCFNIQRWSLRV